MNTLCGGLIRHKVKLAKRRCTTSQNTYRSFSIGPRRNQKQSWSSGSSTLRPIMTRKLFKSFMRHHFTQKNYPKDDGDVNSWRWPDGKPKNALLIIKRETDPATQALIDMVKWMESTFPFLNLYVEEKVHEDLSICSPYKSTPQLIDFVITVGGDGTLLHASKLFEEYSPPVVSFHLGSLGFLMTHPLKEYKKSITKVIEGNFTTTKRMRLVASVHNHDAVDNRTEVYKFQALNEIAIHRGLDSLLTVNCFVQGQLLTNVIGDGLIVATPTGSTAYSMSCGGSIVHPSVESILITPVAPVSLSFRPIILPPTTKIELSTVKLGRHTISWDGKEETRTIIPDDKIFIEAAPVPFLTVNHQGFDWVNNLRDLLFWNQKVRHK